MDSQLSHLIENSPSVIRNSAMVGAIRIIALLLGLVLLNGGFVFLIAGLFSFDLVSQILPQGFIAENEANLHIVNNITAFMGACAVVLGILLLLLAKVSKQLLKRNSFVFKVWTRWHELEEEARKREGEAPKGEGNE